MRRAWFRSVRLFWNKFVKEDHISANLHILSISFSLPHTSQFCYLSLHNPLVVLRSLKTFFFGINWSTQKHFGVLSRSMLFFTNFWTWSHRDCVESGTFYRQPCFVDHAIIHTISYIPNLDACNHMVSRRSLSSFQIFLLLYYPWLLLITGSGFIYLTFNNRLSFQAPYPILGFHIFCFPCIATTTSIRRFNGLEQSGSLNKTCPLGLVLVITFFLLLLTIKSKSSHMQKLRRKVCARGSASTVFPKCLRFFWQLIFQGLRIFRRIRQVPVVF